jgi:hypothetical protein
MGVDGEPVCQVSRRCDPAAGTDRVPRCGGRSVPARWPLTCSIMPRMASRLSSDISATRSATSHTEASRSAASNRNWAASCVAVLSSKKYAGGTAKKFARACRCFLVGCRAGPCAAARCSPRDGRAALLLDGGGDFLVAVRPPPGRVHRGEEVLQLLGQRRRKGLRPDGTPPD